MFHTKIASISKKDIERIRGLMREDRTESINILTASYSDMDIAIAISLTPDNRYQAILYDDCRICAKSNKLSVLNGEWNIEFKGDTYTFFVKLDAEAQKSERRRPAPEIEDCIYYLGEYYSKYPQYSAEWILSCIGKVIFKEDFESWKHTKETGKK